MPQDIYTDDRDMEQKKLYVPPQTAEEIVSMEEPCCDTGSVTSLESTGDNAIEKYGFNSESAGIGDDSPFNVTWDE